MRLNATAAVTFLALAGLVQQATLAETPEKRLLEEARKIVRDAKESHYSHETHVDAAEGVYDVDCSGYLDYILKQVLLGHYEQVPVAAGHVRPLALQFYELFRSVGPRGDRGWKEILEMKHAKPGDVIAWRLEKQAKGKDTGHIMIIDGEPVEDGPGLYRVVVLDSNLSPHADDTRTEGKTGVGRGTMWFKVDEKGRPIAYHWKLKDGKLHEMEIAIGRAEDVERR